MSTTRSKTLPRDDPHSLLRVLGLSTAVAVVVGNVIGSGIFLKPGTIAADSGQFGMIISGWFLGGVLCLLGALSLAELATMLPHAGGLYVYLREAYGRPVAFLFGWNDFIFNRPGSIAALAVAFAGALAEMLGWGSSQLEQVAVAVSVIALIAWVNVLGVIWGGHLQNVTTWIKASFLALIAVLPFAMAFLGASAAVEVSNYETTLEPRSGGGLTTQFGLVLLAVMWAYNGWHGVSSVAEEIREPQRNIPRALFWGIGLLMLLYLSVNVAYHGVLPMEQMAAADQQAAQRVVERLLGSTGAATMSAVIMCSVFGALNANLLLGPRVAFAMGRDRVFFPALGRVHANYHTPAMAIVVQAVMAVLLILAVAQAKSFVQDVDAEGYSWELTRLIVTNLQNGSIFGVLTDFVIFAASIFYVLAVAAVLMLRFRRPDLERPYRTLWYPLPPVLFVLVYFWFLAQVYHGKPLEANAGLVLIALGVPVYYIGQRIFGDHTNRSREAVV